MNMLTNYTVRRMNVPEEIELYTSLTFIFWNDNLFIW